MIQATGRSISSLSTPQTLRLEVNKTLSSNILPWQVAPLTKMTPCLMSRNLTTTLNRIRERNKHSRSSVSRTLSSWISATCWWTERVFTPLCLERRKSRQKFNLTIQSLKERRRPLPCHSIPPFCCSRAPNLAKILRYLTSSKNNSNRFRLLSRIKVYRNKIRKVLQQLSQRTF